MIISKLKTLLMENAFLNPTFDIRNSRKTSRINALTSSISVSNVARIIDSTVGLLTATMLPNQKLNSSTTYYSNKFEFRNYPIKHPGVFSCRHIH